jgi:signal transduction histidine kinase
MSNMFLNIVSTFKGDGISAATRQLGAFGSAAGGLGSTLGKVGSALAAFGIAAKAVEFTKTSIDSARDLERNMFSLNTVFDDMAPVMAEFTENAHEIGLSQKDAAKAATFLGSVLKQSGFSMADTSKETQKLVALGVDLAATYGYDVQEALLGMTALFRGEYDPIEKFGVAMKQSEINAELAARGLNNLEGAARRNAEQVIRMELLYQRAADATGAFTGQSGNLFVEQKKLQAQFENMQASIGTQLLPVMGALVEALVPLVDYLGPKISQAVTDSLPALQGFTDLIKDMSDTTTTTGQTMEFLTTTLGSFFGFIAGNFGVLVQLSLLIGGVTLSLQLFTAALTFITAHPIIATLTALAALFLLVANANKNLTYATDETAASVTSFNTSLAQSASASEYVGGKYGIVATELGNVRRQAEAATESLDDVLRAMDVLSPNQASNRARRNQMRTDNRARAALASIAAPTAGGAGGGKDLAAEAAKAAEKAAKELADAMEKAAKEAAKEQERIAKELQDALDDAAKVEADRLQRREDAYKSFADSVKSIFGGIKDSIMSAFSLPDLGNSVNSITRNIQKLLSRTKDFARNITSLSQQGLSNDLLQQVIAAGPIQGGRLAQALAGAGGGFIGQLNQAYGEFGGIASDIAGVGTRSAFGNAEVINNYYQIEVSGGVGSGPTIGRAIVDAIKSYERTSGAVWQGA